MFDVWGPFSPVFMQSSAQKTLITLWVASHDRPWPRAPAGVGNQGAGGSFFFLKDPAPRFSYQAQERVC